MAIVIGFQRLVERTLDQAGFKFETEKAVGGVQPDIIIQSPDGRYIVLELKARTNLSADDLRRATREAEYIRDAAKADGALVVVPDAAQRRLPAGVATVDSLLADLGAKLAHAPKRRKVQLPLEKVKPTVFAAMPFDEKYDDVFYLGIVPAAKAVGAKALRIDKEEFNGDIVAKIGTSLQSAVAVVADISEAKPNVLCEAGYAQALMKPCIHICSTPLKNMPFDVSHWNTIQYKLGQVHMLRVALTKRLKATIAGTAA